MGNKETERKRNYRNNNCVIVNIKVNRNTSSDVIERLESKNGYQAYLRALIRADMARQKGE